MKTQPSRSPRLAVASAAVAGFIFLLGPVTPSATAARAKSGSGMTLSELLKKHMRAAVRPGANRGPLDGQMTYAISAGGLSGVMTEFDSPPKRFRIDFSLGPISYTVADDGKSGWERDASGNVRVLRGAELAENRSAQNFSLETYDPVKSKKDATVVLRPQREEETGAYIVDVTPTGGTMQSLFLNPHTFLVDKIVAHKGGMAGTIQIKEYREVEGIMVPALLEIGYESMPIAVTAKLQSAHQGVTLNPAVFRAPVLKKDYEFIKNPDATSAVIPFEMSDNEIVVPVSINGKTLRFILDSGAGSSFLTGRAAENVGLETQGNLAAIGYGGSATTGIAAKTSLTVSDAVKISGLPLYVIRDPGIAKMLDDKVGVDGALGYDVFARFIVTIDYRNKRLILASPGSTANAVASKGSPIKIPIRLEMHTPTIAASVDGKKSGRFLVDTGDSGTIHLYDAYATANGLKPKINQAGVTMRPGVGIGGVMMELITPNHSVNLGGHTVKPITMATIAGKGMNGISELAGGIGNGVLSKFLVTVDYDAGQIVLLPPAPLIPNGRAENTGDTTKPAAPGNTDTTKPAAPDTTAPPPPPPAIAEPAPAAGAFPGLMSVLPELLSPRFRFVASPRHRTQVRAEGAPVTISLDELKARHIKALGGAKALDRIKTTRVMSTVTTGGETGTVLSIFAAPNKEYEEDKVGLMNVHQAFDGKEAWQLDSNGNLRSLGGDELKDLENQLFFDTNSYVLPGKRPGQITLRPTREPKTGNYIMDIVPEGGKPATLFFDPNTYLIVKEQHSNDDVNTTTTYSRYMRVDGVAFPGMQLQTNGNSHYDVVLKVQKITNNVAVPDSLFRAPSSTAKNTFIKPGATSAVVPFDFDDGEIAIEAELNSHSVRLLFDSGSSTLALSSELTKTLNLKHGGYLEARGYGGSVDLRPVLIDNFELPGAIRLTQMTAAAIPFSGGLGDLAHGKVFGFLGYDILSRYVVRVDYQHRKMTLTDPKAFKPTAADGEPLDAVIEDNIPTIQASLDGLPAARYLIDTGDVAKLRLYSPYVAANNLSAKYPHGQMSAGGGIGGRSDSREVKIQRLQIGNTALHGIPAELSLDQKGGVSVLNAGSIGSGLLSKFVVTFDYPHKKVYFAETPETGAEYDTRVLGLILGQEQTGTQPVKIMVKGIETLAPVLGSSLKAGDQLVAIDGRPLGGLPMSEVLDLLKPRPGREGVQLTVRTPTGQSKVIDAQYYDPLV